MRTALSAAIVGSLLLCASPSLAQDAPGGFLYVVTAEVKPGMTAAYTDFLKKVQDAATGAPDSVLVFQRILGGSNRTFFIAIPFSEWSDMDGWMSVAEILTTAYGETEGAALLQASGEMLDSLSIGISQTVPEISSNPNPLSGIRPRFAQVIRTEIDPAFTPQYNQFLRRLKKVEEEAGVSVTRRVVAQGPQSTYTTVRTFDDYSERGSWVGAPGLLENALGEDEGRMLFESQAEAVRTREIYTLRFRPDLSRVP